MERNDQSRKGGRVMDLLQEIERLREQIGNATGSACFAQVQVDVVRALCDAAEAHLQPDLFAVPHQKKSATSAEAARRWRPKAKSNGMKALKKLAEYRIGGLTRDELCRYSGMKESTACGRLRVLQNAGLIKVDGKREASTTYNQNVYFITQKGRDFLALEGATHGKDDGHKAA
jgi:DNA-binding transcriptional ArsR family regulator